MNTDFKRRSGQRKPKLLMSGVAVAVCLFVAAVFERRRLSASAEEARRARSSSAATRVPDHFAVDAFTNPSDSFTGAGPAGDPVWEDAPALTATVWDHEQLDDAPTTDAETLHVPAEVESFASLDQHDIESHVEPEVEQHVTFEPEPQVEVEAWPAAHGPADWQPEAAETGFEHEAEIAPEASPSSDEHAVFEPVAEEPVAAADAWFGSTAPHAAWQPPVSSEVLEPAAGTETAPISAEPEIDTESVIELPTASEPVASADEPKRVPPPRLRRFMGTGATVLVLGLVLGAGILASGATADSTSDPATVPDAVATTAVLPDVLPDTTSTDTTTTATTATDTTTTDTTTIGTTTTDTTTTDTTATTTTPTDTTATTPPPTTPTDPAVTPPPTDTTAVEPPAVDPAAAPVAADPTDPETTDGNPVSTPPVAPSTPAAPSAPARPETPAKHKAKHVVKKAPSKATHASTPDVGAPASSGAPVVTLASGADPIGSILSANSVIPAVDASLLPTPAQVSFYVKAAKPLPKLPTLTRVQHPVAMRLVAVGRRSKVGWTVLAAVARLESNLGARAGLLAGRRLPATPEGDGLGALATFLRSHGATRNPLTPGSAKKALTLYFHGSTRKADRAIALAALYGALGPAGMQKGVRAETARLQRRVLKDKRVHLTIAGRSDIRHGRVDPRVLVTLEYLANSFHKVGISDLVSGGALFSRSGSVSAHLYGRAADVASLHGKVVRGHQGPGTMTEQAIRQLLLLPKSLRPRQIISLMDVDGPTGNHGSFALPDHYDRIQIDY